MPVAEYIEVENAACKPFLKWPGGKRQLLCDLLERFPKHYNRFFEPFIGGGALFFKVSPINGYISDINPDLINMYEVVKNEEKNFGKHILKCLFFEMNTI